MSDAEAVDLTKFAELNLIGKSAAFVRALKLVARFATCDAPVLIQGETGTGKELAARAIHYLGKRRNLPFVPVNCGAIPDNLVENELFGHAGGAFTDAKYAQLGLVAQAKGGTFFLDEIEVMSARLQGALLRFLQDGEYRPIGGAPVRGAGPRIVAASNADLKTIVRNGIFRQDLLYRLNALPLVLPPLRIRTGDVMMLANEFLHRLNLQSEDCPKAFHPCCGKILNEHDWPGNVRELEHLIYREYFLASESLIEISSIDGTTPPWNSPMRAEVLSDLPFNVAKARVVAEFERAYLTSLLDRATGNVSLASRISGKDRSDLGKLLKRHGLNRHQFVRR